MSPEKQNIGVREKLIRAASLTALTFASAISSGCVEPTISPNPTDPNRPITTETFIPTETPAPTETLQSHYEADVVDITALYNAQPTGDNPIKAVYDMWLAQIKEIPELRATTPSIWALQIKNNGNLEESVILVQKEYTKYTPETFVLNIVSGEGEATLSTPINRPLFARVVMGKDGQYQNVDYYYKDQDGNNVSMLSYAGDQGKFVYTRQDGTKFEMEGLGIYFGKTEDSTTGGKLLSLVPPGEVFYATLPEGSVVDTETYQITDNSGIIIYRYKKGEWFKVEPTVPFESGPSLEFSPLFPAEWHKEWTGNVKLPDGSTLQIPIIVGLASDVIHNPTGNQISSPILGVWMKQDGADAMADAFLRAAHYRYTEIMGNTIVYSEYLKLLKQPAGGEVSLGILDNDGKTRRMAMIDPRQGFSMLMTDELKMPVRYDQTFGVFYGVDGKGRLLFADNEARHWPIGYLNDKAFGTSTGGYGLVLQNLWQMLYFGAYDNQCLLGGSCPISAKLDPEGKLGFDWIQIIDNRIDQQIKDQKLDLPFGLETP